MKIPGRSNRYVDFTVVEITEGGAEVYHFQTEEVLPAFRAEGWNAITPAKLSDWLHMSEPGDMIAFQSGWIFHRIPK